MTQKNKKSFSQDLKENCLTAKFFLGGVSKNICHNKAFWAKSHCWVLKSINEFFCKYETLLKTILGDEIGPENFTLLKFTARNIRKFSILSAQCYLRIFGRGLPNPKNYLAKYHFLHAELLTCAQGATFQRAIRSKFLGPKIKLRPRAAILSTAFWKFSPNFAFLFARGTSFYS